MWRYESEKGAGSKEEEERVHQEKGRRGCGTSRRSSISSQTDLYGLSGSTIDTIT